MASSSTDDGGSMRKEKLEKWEELSSLVSQTTLSNPTDYSKGTSGTDGQFLENTDTCTSETQQDVYLADGGWTNINSRLKQHGFRPVKPVSLNEVEDPRSGIFFDEAEAHMLKNTIERLLDDNERRQALVQELITSSNKLQEEVNEKTDKAYRYDREMSRFRKELKSQQSIIQELEQKRLNELRSHGEEIQELSIAKADLQGRYDVLDQKCVEMEQQIVELRYQNQELVATEQERQARTGLPKDNFPTKDDTNSQESKFSQPENDGDRSMTVPDRSTDDDPLQSTPKNSDSNSGTIDGAQATRQDILPSMKLLEGQLKTTEKHVEESKKLISLLEDDNNKLISELKKRPGLDEWRKAWKYNKKLEKVLAENNLSISSKRAKDAESNEKKRSKRYKTQVKDIDLLPIDICRKHIKRICLRLNVSDLKEIVPVLESFVQMRETQKKMETLIRKILEIIDVKHIPFQLLDNISDSTEPRDHSVYCEKAWKLILPTLKTWSNELKKVQELKDDVVELSRNLFPWKPAEELFQLEHGEQVKVEDVRAALGKIISTEDRSQLLQDDDPTTVKQLRCIVTHFQKLFDVKTIVGIFPRMNEVYSKVGETQNIMKTIRETLSLDPHASSVEVVNAICKIQTAKHYLKIEDLPGILKRLEEYDEFFPAFQSLISQLYDLLGVDKIDEILTAVRALMKFPVK